MHILKSGSQYLNKKKTLLSIFKFFIILTNKSFHKNKLILAALSRVAANVLGLGGGRGIAKAWTGAELPKSCIVSHETRPA